MKAILMMAVIISTAATSIAQIICIKSNRCEKYTENSSRIIYKKSSACFNKYYFCLNIDGKESLFFTKDGYRVDSSNKKEIVYSFSAQPRGLNVPGGECMVSIKESNNKKWIFIQFPLAGYAYEFSSVKYTNDTAFHNHLTL